MACTSERAAQIGDLVVGRLATGAVPALLDHVEGCPACSEEFDLSARLVAHHEAAAPPARAGVPWAARWAGLLAAGLLMAAGLWWGTRSADAGLGERLGDLASLEPLPAATALLRSPAGEARGAEWQAAMAHYAAGDFDAAASALAPAFERNREDALAALYLGISLLQTDARADAAGALGAAAEHGEGLIQERALWYLSNAALRDGDHARALSLLDRLIALGGDYELNARDLAAEVRSALDG